MDKFDTIIIGAGIIGLAVGRALAQSGQSVLVLEAEGQIGTKITARNSQVIHAGLYYSPNSLKARFCTRGNVMLREFCQNFHVPHCMIGKWIVATDGDESAKLDALYQRGLANQVRLRRVSGAKAIEAEPELFAKDALLSPDTGILSVADLMLALSGDFEAAGGTLALKVNVIGGGQDGDGCALVAQSDDGTCADIWGQRVFVCAGLETPNLMRRLGAENVPQSYLCKGHYFGLKGRSPFSRLVYPLPVAAGLGIHFTLDMGGQGRFGPDVEWVETENYVPDPGRVAAFEHAIRRYWPKMRSSDLFADSAGIRPKIHGPHQEQPDFLIHTPTETGIAGVFALYGFESPGLTSALAVGEYVKDF